MQTLHHIPDFFVTEGTALTQSMSFYDFNNTQYQVNSVFEPPDDDATTLTERVFRILEHDFTHLIAVDGGGIINDEYTCLTATEKEAT